MEDKTCITAFWKPSEKRWCACVRRGKAQYSLYKVSLCPLAFNAAPLTSTTISASSPRNLCFMVPRQEISSFLPGWEIGYQRGSQRTEGSRWSHVVFNWTTKQSSFIQHFVETGCLQSLGFWGIVDLTHWVFLSWVSQLLHLLCDSKWSLPCLQFSVLYDIHHMESLFFQLQWESEKTGGELSGKFTTFV